MNTVPNGFVRVRYKGVTRVSGTSGPIPVILLQDDNERTIAIPIHPFEADLFHRSLQINDEYPQPYRSLLNCLKVLGVKLNAVHILYTDQLDFQTYLILQPDEGDKLEINVNCSEGIAYAELSGAPVYVAEKIMADISVGSHNSENT
jgi:bifunctional DNase/RNase